ISHAAQQSSGDARVIASAPGNLIGAVGSNADAEDARAAIADLFKLAYSLEIEPHRNAETVAQRIGEEPGAGGRTDQRELGQIDLDGTGRRSGADDEIELKIFHRRIEDFLDGRIEPVDLVDEQNVALLEIGQ